MANYIGLDQSLANTGYAVLADDVVYYGCVSTPAEHLTEKRIQTVLDKLAELTEKFQPQIVFTEKVFADGRMASRKTAQTLLKVEGCIHQELYKSKINFVIVDSSKWAKAAGAEGNKEKFKSFLAQYTEAKFNSHEADAVGILLGGLVISEIIEIDISKLKFVAIECHLKEKKVQRKRTAKKEKQSVTAA